MRHAIKAVPLAILVIVGVVLLLRGWDRPEKRSAAVTPSTVEPAERVEVEHSIDTADVEVERTLVTAERVAGSATPPHQGVSRGTASPGPSAARPLAARASTRRHKPGLAAQTARALLGDGRHKPQPFPRINNN